MLGLGSLTFSVPSAPGRPLNFCQSPVIFSSCQHGLGGLGADAQPVLRALRVDLDEARLFLRVVPADDLDGTTVTTVARVGDGDAVLGIADLAEAG